MHWLGPGEKSGCAADALLVQRLLFEQRCRQRIQFLSVHLEQPARFSCGIFQQALDFGVNRIRGGIAVGFSMKR